MASGETITREKLDFYYHRKWKGNSFTVEVENMEDFAMIWVSKSTKKSFWSQESRGEIES